MANYSSYQCLLLFLLDIDWVGAPYGLLHEAHPAGNDAVMGLAAYKGIDLIYLMQIFTYSLCISSPRDISGNIRAFKRIVGSLRATGYDGHIILGVSKDISTEEIAYLKENQVTMYIVDFVECDDTISTGGAVKGAIRGKCSKGLENLKLEWGRFEMCRQWLYACKACTGWSLVMDTRDIFFQAHPFADLPKASPSQKPKEDLLFIEEIAPHSSPDPNPVRSFIAGNFRNAAHILPCYGKEKYEPYAKRPVLCSGTVIGTRDGMHRFLSVLVTEFHSNNKKENIKCRSPTTTDQWTMNWLYYNGYFGLPDQTKTVPWGTGSVLTVGKSCIGANRKSGASDIVWPKGKGLIENIHEKMPNGMNRTAPVIHQFDRCGDWISEYFDDNSGQEVLFRDFNSLRTDQEREREKKKIEKRRKKIQAIAAANKRKSGA